MRYGWILGLLLCVLALRSPGYAITVSLQFDYTDSGQTGFAVYRCTGSGCTPTTTIGSPLGPSVRQVADGTAAGGTTYRYAVQALGEVDSALSNVLEVVVPTPGLATALRFATPPQASTNTNQAMNTVQVEVIDGFGTRVTSSSASITVALVAPTQTAIPQHQVSLVSVDSEETTDCGYGSLLPGTAAVDGLTTTFWHTAYCTSSPGQPHTIIVNLGNTYNVTGFRYLPRQDGELSGNIAGYQFSVSLDGSTWGSLAASGTFANNASEKTVTFMGRSGRYVRLVSTSEVFGQVYTNVAELTTLQTPTGSGALTCPGGCAGAASSGLKSYAGLSVNAAGSYTLQATASGLTSVSAPFLIVDAPAPTQVPRVVRMGH